MSGDKLELFHLKMKKRSIMMHAAMTPPTMRESRLLRRLIRWTRLLMSGKVSALGQGMPCHLPELIARDGHVPVYTRSKQSEAAGVGITGILGIRSSEWTHVTSIYVYLAQVLHI